VLLDVDNFKYINETFGHGAGDELLRMIGELIASRARDTDIVARLGGDEFAIQLLGASEEDARAVGDHLLTRIRALRALSGGRTIHCTASIGVVAFDGTIPSLADAIVDADSAMYAAKEAGRDRVVVHTPLETRRLRHAAKSSPEHRIREALSSDGFQLYTQPILDLRTGAVARHEVLLRMQTDEGIVLPGDFLGTAERLGLSSAIDRWVVEHAIELLAKVETLDPDVCLEINLSGRSLGDPELPAVIANHASAARIDPARLVFEITETAAIANMQQARRFATALTQLGCSFALDDFGAGFGSFYYLKHLPLQYVKIDGEFVRAPRSRADELFIEAIVQVARGLGKETIAEFVGDDETLALMRAYGVDFVQGYHIGRPAPADEMLAGLRASAA
jgi:diguanylate cyclase (GGDEF)-like protein